MTYLRSGRPMIGEKPLTSTERSMRTRRRSAARLRALELYVQAIRLDVTLSKIVSYDLTEMQKQSLAYKAYGMLRWLDDRLADLDAAADFFELDAQGRQSKNKLKSPVQKNAAELSQTTENVQPHKERSSKRAAKKIRPLHVYIVPGAYVWVGSTKLAFVIAVEKGACSSLVRSNNGEWSAPLNIRAHDTDPISFPTVDEIETFRSELRRIGRLSLSSKLGKRTVRLPDGSSVTQPIELLDEAQR